jgi:hypothetical protein
MRDGCAGRVRSGGGNSSVQTPEVEAASGRHLKVEAAASGAGVDAESGGGVGGRAWRRRRRRRRGLEEAAAAASGDFVGVFDEFCLVFSTRTAPVTWTPSNYVFVMGLGLSY